MQLISVIMQQLSTCEQEIENVLKAIRKGIITESTQTLWEELEAQRASLKYAGQHILQKGKKS